MFTKKDRRPYVPLFKLVIIAFVLASVSISILSSMNAYAATRNGGAELLVNGKAVKLTPVSSARPDQPRAVQYCAFVFSSETNESNDGTYASFDYSLTIQNLCPNGVAVTSGGWNAQGSIDCGGTWYDNPPSETGTIPEITAGGSARVVNQQAYEAVCIGEIGGIIPYLYPPSEISITSVAAGALSNGNTWSDAETDSFFP